MPKKILLADDSITIQKVVELTFSDGDYLVIPTSNGAKAIQKLSEVRPDIILSDIIMPEKNGYEVCEYVKSHPDFRSIPVILLTGTFEPFDPDRAEKAGCDAVVTKPFESQSLVQKVEELLARSGNSGESRPAATEDVASGLGVEKPAPAASFESDWNKPPRKEEHDSPFSSSSSDSPFDDAPNASPAGASSDPSLQLDEPFASSSSKTAEPAPFQARGEDLFGAPEPESASSSSLPFETPAPPPPAMFGGETRAFPKMSLADLQKMAAESEPSTPPSPPTPPTPAPPSAPSSPPPSPWADAGAAESPFGGGGETRAFPRMSLEDLKKLAGESEPSPASAAPAAPQQGDAAPFEASPFSSEAPVFPSSTETEKPERAEETPWSAPEAGSAPDWSVPPSSVSSESQSATSSADVLPFSSPAAEPPPADSASWSSPASSGRDADSSSWPEPADSFAPVSKPQDAPTGQGAPASGASAASQTQDSPLSLTAEQIDQIARRVVERIAGGDPPFPFTAEQMEQIARRMVDLMAPDLVRNIAWEVIPDMAATLVKERIRELEAEA